MKYFFKSLVGLFLIGFVTLAHADTKVFFSPNGGCETAVLSEIKNAHKSIDIAMFSFTSKDIAQALLEAKHRDVKIRIALDNSQIKEHSSKSKYMISKGLNVKFHMGPGLMHDKFAIIDDREVLTGSFNWTMTADKKNAENLLVIADKKLAQKYTKQFKHLWSQSGEGQ